MRKNLRDITFGMKVLNILSYILISMSIIGIIFIIPSCIENTNGFFSELFNGILIFVISIAIGYFGNKLYNYSHISIYTINEVEKIIDENIFIDNNDEEFRKNNFKDILKAIQE